MIKTSAGATDGVLELVEREEIGCRYREEDGRPYPPDVDPDFYDEIFPPIRDDVLHKMLQEASDAATVIALAGEVLQLARTRQQTIGELRRQMDTQAMLHRQRTGYLEELNRDLAAEILRLRAQLK